MIPTGIEMFLKGVACAIEILNLIKKKKITTKGAGLNNPAPDFLEVEKC